MSTQHTMDQDVFEALTHIVNKKLTEFNGAINKQVAAQASAKELMSNLDDKAGSISQKQISTVFEDKDAFTINNGEITNVKTVGPRPNWLEPLTTSGTANGSIDYQSITNLEPSTDDDLNEINTVRESQVDILEDEGYTSYSDLAEADPDELANLPSFTSAQAKTIVESATELRDNTELIAQEAYSRLAKERITNKDTPGHRITEVPIPAGPPRGPAYERIGEPRFVFGLPILELPTLDVDIIKELIDLNDTRESFVASIEGYANNEVQAEYFRDEIFGSYESYENLQTANESELADLILQPAIRGQKLTYTLDEAFESATTYEELITYLNDNLKPLVTEKAQINIISTLKDQREQLDLNSISSVDDLAPTGITVDDLYKETITPIEIDHPFIDDPSSYPSYYTRPPADGDIVDQDDATEDLKLVANLQAKDSYTVDLVGHAGTGKDTLFKFLAALRNQPVLSLDMSENLISQELMGVYKVNEHGAMEFQDGVIPHAAKYGFKVILSEANAAPPGVMTALHQVLEDDSPIHVRQADEIIEPRETFDVGFTRNPSNSTYNARNTYDGAMARRVISIPIDELNKEDETDLLDELVNNEQSREIIPRKKIESLVEMAHEFRAEAEGSTSRIPRISTTKLRQIIDVYDVTGNLVEAADIVIRGRLEENHDPEAVQNIIVDNLDSN